MIGGLRRKATAVLAATLVATGISITTVMPSAAAATGCQDITAAPGHYAQTTDEYAGAWSINSHGPLVYWYIKHTDGSIQDHGYVQGTGTEAIAEPSNIYYLQISNPNTNPTVTAHVCYSG